MKRKTSLGDMTRGNLFTQILVFSFPLMISNLLQVLFNTSDIAVVGRFAGSSALGSVGSTATLVALFTGFLLGIGCGINAVTARKMGAKDSDGTVRTVHTSFVLSLFIGLTVMAVGLIFARFILQILGTKPELLDGAVLYFRIYMFGIPALALYNFGNAVFSAGGETKKPLIFLMISGIINVILNLISVIVFKMGVSGVALASIISQYFSAVCILIALMRANGDIRLIPKRIGISGRAAKEILSLSLPSAFQNTLFYIANLFVQVGVNSFDTVTVEGIAAATNADALVYDVMAAFYTACSSFIGQNYGAKNRERIKKSYMICLMYSLIIGTVLGVSLYFAGHTFLSLFTKDSEVVSAGMYRLKVMGLSYGVSAFMDCSIAASRGLGKSFVPTVMTIIGSCIFRIAWIYTIFAYFGTVTSLFLLYIFSWSLTAILEIVYFTVSYRKCTRDFRPA